MSAASSRPRSRRVLRLLSPSLALALGLSLGACGEVPAEEPPAAPKKRPSLAELKQKSVEQSPEEIAAARKAAGFKTQEEIAAENAAMFEKGAREYIKTRAAEYKKIIGELRAQVDALEKGAADWKDKSDPQKAFDKFMAKHKKKSKDLIKRYMALTGNGAEGGNTQAIFSQAVRGLEDLEQEIGPLTGKSERLPQVLADIRKGLDDVEKAVGEIEKDESLLSNKFYDGEKPPEEGGDAKAE